jgi:SAM-dependent methyltransferase
MSWFESWFDSPYYHILYQHRNAREAEHFLDNLLGFLKPNPGASMLDLGCGKGRHSVYLNEKGFQVTGVDLSEQSIKYCMQFENETLSFFLHDMRKIFRINDFDYVFNLFTSFGYFEKEADNYAAIKNAALALKANGILVIDFLNSDYVVRNLVKEEEVNLEGISFNISKKVEQGYLIKEIRFMDSGIDYHFTEKVQALHKEDFEKYFASAGLKIKSAHGNYDLKQFDPVNSPRLILIASK